MATFYRGQNRRLFASSQQAAAQSSPKKTMPRCDESPERRERCAVEVSQDGCYIVIEGSDSADRVRVTHQKGNQNHPYDDQIVVSWTSGGVTHSKSFDLYKHVLQGDKYQAVKNVSAIEFHGGAGNDKFSFQTGLESYLTDDEGRGEQLPGNVSDRRGGAAQGQAIVKPAA